MTQQMVERKLKAALVLALMFDLKVREDKARTIAHEILDAAEMILHFHFPE